MPVPAAGASAPRQLLRDSVFVRIRDAIIDGTLEPGERLLDGDLSGWLGVSRTPIREALARLEAAGLVETKPGRYTIVSPIDPRSVADAQEVTAAMHELAVRTAVPLLTGADLAAMRSANEAFAAALAAGDVVAAIAADDAFHGVAVDRGGNGAIRAVLDNTNGVVPGRPRDTFGIGWARTQLSDNFVPFLRQRLDLGLDEEDAIEMYYNASITPWLSVSPGIQIIDSGFERTLDPNNRLEKYDTAAVFFLRTYLRF